MHTPETLSFALKPTQQEIAAVAFELYQARGGGPGQDLDDWLQAEQQLMQELAENAKTREPVPTLDAYPTGLVGGVPPLAPGEHSGAPDKRSIPVADEIGQRTTFLRPAQQSS